NEVATIEFDSVQLTLSDPSPADDDGNLALSAPDLIIDANEAGNVIFVISGLDADATAEVIVSDGDNTASGTSGSDGEVVLDLSTLAEGTLTTSVTATDGEGNTATAQGPEMLRVPATSFAGETRALSIDLVAGTYTYAARVLPYGDSLTYGYLGDTDSETVNNRADSAGYREVLFENLLQDGAFVDYVGVYSSGPEGMLDSDHTGVPGKELRQAINNAADAASFQANLADLDPDVVLFMMGTNDFNYGGDAFYADVFDTLIARIETVVELFYQSDVASTAHLVISTIPPKPYRNLLTVSEAINEGYSIVNGTQVVGDAGNGTYHAGIKATVSALQATYATLHLYDAPFDTALIGDDLVHLTAEGYEAYADGLQTLLESEIGISGGTLGGSALSLSANNVEGGEAGDRIAGNSAANVLSGAAGNDVLLGAAGNDTLNGGAGSDRLEGGTGVDELTGDLDADSFVFDSGFASPGGAPDLITDFGQGADKLYLWDGFEGGVTLTQSAQGVLMTLAGSLQIDVRGSAATDLIGLSLGDGSFALTTDETLVSFFSTGSLLA
ncbi:Hemolysin-type calcium-binding repeat-containing protein, partial [Alloyangia pacifica]